MNRYIKLKICYVMMVWILHCSYNVFGCTSTTAQYKQIGDSVTLEFQATMTNSLDTSIIVSNVISSNNGSTLLGIAYRDGVLLNSPTCNGCTITGNVTTGDLSIRLDNLQTSNSGTYKLSVTEAIHEVKGCIILYILGKPEKPTIQSNNNNSIEGMNVKLTCMSRSTTNPSDPNLNLQYDWRVDTEDNPQVYEYSQTKNILTIKNLDRQDAKKRFTCKATESGSSVTGLTSNYSDEFMLNVLYGPDGCEISVKSPVTVKVGSISPLIKCRSDCYPLCTYKWTNASSGSSIVSANGDFEIDSITRYHTGNYACECGNSATEIGTTHTEILQIIV
ncbi:carcinoembryonic antigen-related cell adhesion molecule 8-like isoform X1 [Ruditapes philippinarum]|uniref:carcinoembryonic antigen-related cell adhesion molecule 8-like isoform X1 n=1 Tax=Ruditapes philippinarum TaxID=129788 RepID=UPI00295A9DC1|nr:carcinoembryonic antigen-related cell adhesion molecule 8-like isoform X1 [Ruditapes philippinarum]XP_060580821.1 carcinoembryonic antigen-related cell adhesion molecule 8-like isoform X1 [Ruditapes philippinarum]